MASLAATTMIVAIFGGLPLAIGLRILRPSTWASARILGLKLFDIELLGIRLFDIALAMWMLVAIVLVARLYVQNRPTFMLPGFSSSARSVSGRVVELSAFGSGRLVDWTTSNPNVGLERLTTPSPVEDLDNGRRSSRMARRSRVDRQDDRSRSKRTRSEPGLGPILQLDDLQKVEYVVRRGDTFWSLAERSLGDGMRWTELRDLNIGREVGGGAVLSDESVLRSGWTILLPSRRREATHVDA